MAAPPNLMGSSTEALLVGIVDYRGEEVEEGARCSRGSAADELSSGSTSWSSRLSLFGPPRVGVEDPVLTPLGMVRCIGKLGRHVMSEKMRWPKRHAF